MKAITVAIFLVLATFSIAEDLNHGEGAKRRIKTIVKLCTKAKKEPGVPEAFFGCYDQAAGKEHFVKCQEEHFGGVLDNEETITHACKNFIKFPVYAFCVGKEFKNGEADFKEAIKIVTACQAKVVGVE